jgi:hypothetical protein
VSGAFKTVHTIKLAADQMTAAADQMTAADLFSYLLRELLCKIVRVSGPICMLRFEKIYIFPSVLLMFGLVHPNTPRGLLAADRGMRYPITELLQRTFENIQRSCRNMQT